MISEVFTARLPSFLPANDFERLSAAVPPHGRIASGLMLRWPLWFRARGQGNIFAAATGGIRSWCQTFTWRSMWKVCCVSKAFSACGWGRLPGSNRAVAVTDAAWLPLHAYGNHFQVHRILHTLDVAADNCLTGTSGWRGSIEITWRGSIDMPSFPIHCKCMGGWFVLKSIAHGSKCPIELCLNIDVNRKFS